MIAVSIGKRKAGRSTNRMIWYKRSDALISSWSPYWFGRFQTWSSRVHAERANLGSPEASVRRAGQRYYSMELFRATRTLDLMGKFVSR